jgi:hypothetical protein
MNPGDHSVSSLPFAPPEKLNEKVIEQLPIPAKGNRITYFAGATIQGAKVPRGFGVRVTAGGSRAFVLNYRLHGREHRVTIGAYPDWSALKAVRHARLLRQRIDRDENPFADQNLPVRRRHIASKFEQITAGQWTAACNLYRHYDHIGELLYVGISLDVLARQRKHLHGADWRAQICSIMVEPFASRDEALAAEQIAITDEFPKYNRRDNEHAVPFLIRRSGARAQMACGPGADFQTE